MALVRIFDTREEAEAARKILEKGNIKARVTEDNLWGVPIQKFGVRARFRLLVADEDYLKTAKYLAGKKD